MNFSVNQMKMSDYFTIQEVFWSWEQLQKKNVFAKQEKVDDCICLMLAQHSSAHL